MRIASLAALLIGALLLAARPAAAAPLSLGDQASLSRDLASTPVQNVTRKAQIRRAKRVRRYDWTYYPYWRPYQYRYWQFYYPYGGPLF
jgi:hypothetical protein